jgi:PAS domain-containing protein
MLQKMRWLRPSPVGPLDRVTYRLRLVLAIQIAVFGLITFLVLYLGRSTSPWLALPELVSHAALGLFLWINRITWATVLTISMVGVLGIALGNAATLEVFFIFFIIPLVLPFYSSTRIALTTQILTWVMVGGAGAGIAIAAPDRMPWTALVIEASAIGLVGTLMVIFRFSLLRLTGANQRLENVLSQYRLLYDDSYRATLVLGGSGNIRAVYGSSEALLGAGPEVLVGVHYSKLPSTIKGSQGLWETYLRGKDGTLSYESVTPAQNGDPARIRIRLTPGQPRQRAAGIALVVELQQTHPS